MPTRNEIAVIRGHADAAALAVACHDPGLHAKLAPPGGEARAVFEAIEQARVEAIGAKRMEGVSANLTARLEQRYERSRINESTDRSEAPLPEALALLVRERLTGLAPPSKARAIANLWRPWIEGRARAVLDRMPDTVSDQDAFGRLTRDLLAALNLADQLDQTGEEGQRGEGGRAGALRGGGRDRRRRRTRSRPSSPPTPRPTRTPLNDETARRARGRRGRPSRPRVGHARRAAPAGALAPQPLGAR